MTDSKPKKKPKEELPKATAFIDQVKELAKKADHVSLLFIRVDDGEGISEFMRYEKRTTK